MQCSHSLCAPWLLLLLLQRLVHQLLMPLLWGQAAEVLPEVLTLRYPVHGGDTVLQDRCCAGRNCLPQGPEGRPGCWGLRMLMECLQMTAVVSCCCGELHLTVGSCCTTLLVHVAAAGALAHCRQQLLATSC
jgi:hypothetical protein